MSNNTIKFKLTAQVSRFAYFGLCLPKEFLKEKFIGKLFEMGKGMWAVRQNTIAGKYAVTLHDCLK